MVCGPFAKYLSLVMVPTDFNISPTLIYGTWYLYQGGGVPGYLVDYWYLVRECSLCPKKVT